MFLFSVHTANIVREWFEHRPEFDVLNWPPRGADMNVIENVWGTMVQDLQMHSQPVANSDVLWDRIQYLWNLYRPNFWQMLVDSFENRLRLVQDMQGGWSKY